MTSLPRIEDMLISEHSGPAFRVIECHDVPKTAPKGCAQVALVTTYELNGCTGKVIHTSYGDGDYAEIAHDAARKRDRWVARMQAEWNGCNRAD
jgi:hypothetical protein